MSEHINFHCSAFTMGTAALTESSRQFFYSAMCCSMCSICMQFIILLIEHFVTVAFMEISHSGVLLAEFVWLFRIPHLMNNTRKWF